MPAPRRRTRGSRTVVAALAAAALIAGCGGDDSGGETRTTGSTRAESSTPSTADEPSASGGDRSTSTTSPVPPASLVGASTEPKAADPSSSTMEPAELTRVRLGAHDGYERVVFEFQGELPGYDAGYLESDPVEDGSGDPVDVKGAEVLSVRIHPASGFRMSDNSYETIYTGPTRLAGAAAPVIEVVRSGDFEAQLTWVIGLDERQPFVVSTLSSPPRIVVDIADR